VCFSFQFCLLYFIHFVALLFGLFVLRIGVSNWSTDHSSLTLGLW
jgi:hypothetical protein